MNTKLKIVLIISFILIIICAIFTISILTKNPYVKKFDEKIELIEKAFSQDFPSNNLSKNIVIISISNMEKQATVKFGLGNSLNSAFSNAKSEISKFIQDNDYNVEWVKLDIVDYISSNFQYELESVNSAYNYRKGIFFEDSNRTFVLTEAELNSNSIIDYSSKSLDLNHLNDYLNLPSYEKFQSQPSNIKSFTTKSFFCDENNMTYSLFNTGANTGRRILKTINSNSIYDIISNASNYLFNMIKDDGKFNYGYYLTTNKEIPDYNILRHAGSVWSLIVTYDDDPDGAKKVKINSSLDYLKNNLANNSDSYYIISSNENENELSLGGNALATLAFCEYTTAFSDNQYVELAEKLGNGILSMQQSDGHFVHILNPDFSVKKDYSTYLYDGESIFALCKLYGITKNEKYLNSAEKALQYCINKDYTIYKDHWLSYAINEITKYVDNPDYYNFGLKNFTRNVNNFDNLSSASSINFELLVQSLKLYNTVSAKNINVSYMTNFPIAKLNDLIQSQVDLRSFFIFIPRNCYVPKRSCKTL